MLVQAPVLNICSSDLAAFTDTGVYPDEIADVDAYGFAGYLFSGVIHWMCCCEHTAKFEVPLLLLLVLEVASMAGFNPANFLDFLSFSGFLILLADCFLRLTISENFRCTCLVLYL